MQLLQEYLTYLSFLQALSPDNTYGVDSGGDPNDIPKLTFEEFKVSSVLIFYFHEMILSLSFCSSRKL